ncbi:MAG TPA: ABC transporter ATP-binding protein [Candidatus Paceibacterota bacterium]|nr:ABC transporter ATP-binding protein [Candidatus Paceibacterota bacterium]
MADDALIIESLRKTYAGGTEALKGISLTVPRGDFFALLGPNGAGKSTLIGIATGLVTKSGGRLVVDGIDADDAPERARRHVGVVPQGLNIDWFGKVLDTVVNQAGYYGISRAQALPRAKKLLTDLGLGDKMHVTARELSGGMQRRLMIARALIHEPTILFLDEPTAGVDVELRRGMWEYLRTLTKDGVTILLTTHYLEEAEQLAGHVAIINKGTIIEQGRMAEVLAKLSTEDLILEVEAPAVGGAIAALAGFRPLAAEGGVQITLDGSRNVTDAVKALDAKGIAVRTARSKSGRLEELFLRLTQDTK